MDLTEGFITYYSPAQTATVTLWTATIVQLVS
jgi:hypothetical protein